MSNKTNSTEYDEFIQYEAFTGCGNCGDKEGHCIEEGTAIDIPPNCQVRVLICTGGVSTARVGLADAAKILRKIADMVEQRHPPMEVAP